MRALRTTIVLAVLLVGPGAQVAAARPIVWVQAGHEGPREPGYANQTGAGSGPFGSELGFTTRTAAALVTRLQAAGVDARRTPGKVAPWAATGATFISIHHDSAGGRAAVGHAVTSGGGENYYHGEGDGTASPTPYADSAPHRSATRVSASVQRASSALAMRVAASLGRVHTPTNGADGPFGGVISPGGNRRMMHFYGYYRTNATARILVECGAPGVDDRFLAKTDLVAKSLADALVTDLRARSLLP